MRARWLPLVGLLLSACGGTTAGGATIDAGLDASPDATPATDAAAKPDGPDAAEGTDAACVFLASNYDQSCVADSDCSTVTSTDYCTSSCLCGGSPISTAGLAQFNKDISSTPLGSHAISSGNCSCFLAGRLCCLKGTCTIDTKACDEKDTLAACADAGGLCSPNVVECGPRGAGPPNSCALPDETCCL